jgi:hypothetical protein
MKETLPKTHNRKKHKHRKEDQKTNLANSLQSTTTEKTMQALWGRRTG